MWAAYLNTTASVWPDGLTLVTGCWTTLGVCSSWAGAGQLSSKSLLSCAERRCKIWGDGTHAWIAPQHPSTQKLRSGIFPKATQVQIIGILFLLEHHLQTNHHWRGWNSDKAHSTWGKCTVSAQAADSPGQALVKTTHKLFLQQPTTHISLLYSIPKLSLHYCNYRSFN